jgi:hypothetical protein
MAYDMQRKQATEGNGAWFLMIPCRISSNSDMLHAFDPEDGSISSETQVNSCHTTSRHVRENDTFTYKYDLIYEWPRDRSK